MWSQFQAIAWAQLRVARNHLPRTSVGTVLTSLLMLLWYGFYLGMAAVLGWKIPEFSTTQLDHWLPEGLLGVFLFWQLTPLFTLTSGWSLQLDKLRIYPISDRTLFAIETVLRLTSAPEMFILLFGAMIGLFRHPSIPFYAPFFVILFIPLNLFLQMAVRDLILHSFERNRFRELFATLMICVAVLPQVVFRTGLGRSFAPYYSLVAESRFGPWYEIARLSTSGFHVASLALVLTWTALSFGLARWMFKRSLLGDNGTPSRATGASKSEKRARSDFASWPGRIFSDPLAALLQKEFQCLLRMPKFRVLFGMSCILGLLVFVPAAMNNAEPTSSFTRNNLLPIVNVYGLLLLSDTLLLNAFGLDRGAAQLYFVSPVGLGTVMKAKNLTAISFVLLQSGLIVLVAAVAHAPTTPVNIASGLLASAVVCVFLLSAGNFTSLAMPRPIDPKQTLKKQAGARMQLWLLGCSLGLFVLVGFAFLARYALQSDWALILVLSFELLVGLVVYRIGLESAIRRGQRNRENIVQLLSRSDAPVSLG